MRVLVTGSRGWADADVIAQALLAARDQPPPGADGRMVLVSGACPSGADALAESLASLWGWEVERHPADWSTGKAAGFRRNAEMVEAGADLCLAFLGPCTSASCDLDYQHGSHGTKHCAGLAKAAGIPVRWYS